MLRNQSLRKTINPGRRALAFHDAALLPPLAWGYQRAGNPSSGSASADLALKVTL